MRGKAYMTTMTKSEDAIGILDSGVGGLTVAKEVMRQLPRERLYYFGDTHRCPYGSRSQQEVCQFTLEIMLFLLQFPLKAVLIACNTAAAAGLKDMREKLLLPIIDVIEPGARAAIKVTKNHRVGVIGTQRTIQSKAYEKALKKIHPSIKVFSLACPAFVPLVENGHRNTLLAKNVVAEGLKRLQGTDIDTLILGCTHYPLLAEPIFAAMDKRVKVISSAEETAAELSSVLQHQQLLSLKKKGSHRFFTTGSSESFREIAEEWLEQKIKVEQVELPFAEK
jgi:glutamate racemase